MNNDLRQQILVSLRAEGVGEADKAREAMAHIVAEIQRVTKGFSEATIGAAEFKKEATALGGMLTFFKEIADAADNFALKEAEAFAKAAATHEAFLAKSAADADAAALKDAERQAKLAASYEAFLAKESAASEAAALKESERQAKLLADYEAFLAKEAAAAEAAELKEAERVAKLIAAHEAAEAKEDARLARVQAKYEQMLARKDAADSKEEIEEAERLARLAADHEKYLDREAANERKATAEIAAARASLNQQRRDSLDAAFVATQTEALKTQRIMTGFGTAVDHSHDKADKFGYAMLNVSHAFQDLQYGMGAVLNNIPLIMTSFGFGPGAAGAVMAMGVAVEMLRGQLGSLGAALGYADDPAKKLGGTIDEVKAKIAAIDGKAFKFAVDFQDLAEAEARLKRLTKLKALIEGTSETGGEKALSKVAQDITTDAVGGSDALQKAVGDIEATRGIDHASPIDVNIARNAQKQIDKLTKMREGQNFITQAGTDLLIWDMTRRRDEAQKRVSEARGGFVDEEVGKFLAGDPDAIKRMKGRVQDFPGAFTPAGGKAIAGMAGTPEALEAAKKKDLIAQQTVALDLANVEDFEKWKTWNAREQAKKKTEAAAKTRERDQEVQKQANLFGGKLDDQKGPGSLESAILGRAARGQSADEIQGDLSRTMAGQLAGKVPPGLVDDVAAAIVAKAVDAVRAEVLARGGGKVGLNAAIGERADKLDRAQGLEDRRAAKVQAGNQEQMLGQQIFGMTGGQLGEMGSMEAAHRAMNSMKDGVQGQAAIFEAIQNTFMKIAAMQEQGNIAQQNFLWQLNGFQNRFNGLQAQQRNGQAQLPGLIPFFPQ